MKIIELSAIEECRETAELVVAVHAVYQGIARGICTNVHDLTKEIHKAIKETGKFYHSDHGAGQFICTSLINDEKHIAVPFLAREKEGKTEFVIKSIFPITQGKLEIFKKASNLKDEKL